MDAELACNMGDRFLPLGRFKSHSGLKAASYVFRMPIIITYLLLRYGRLKMHLNPLSSFGYQLSFKPHRDGFPHTADRQRQRVSWIDHQSSSETGLAFGKVPPNQLLTYSDDYGSINTPINHSLCSTYDLMIPFRNIYKILLDNTYNILYTICIIWEKRT
jgi:hypothetical protein